MFYRADLIYAEGMRRGWAAPSPSPAALPARAMLAALALFGPKLYQLAMRPKPHHVPGDA